MHAGDAPEKGARHRRRRREGRVVVGRRRRTQMGEPQGHARGRGGCQRGPLRASRGERAVGLFVAWRGGAWRGAAMASCNNMDPGHLDLGSCNSDASCRHGGLSEEV